MIDHSAFSVHWNKHPFTLALYIRNDGSRISVAIYISEELGLDSEFLEEGVWASEA